MSVKVSMRQLQERLADMLDQVDQTGQEFVVQRDGKDCAVLVSARQWRRRKVGHELDALGAAYRLAGPRQARAEQLLQAQQQRRLTAAQRRELRTLLQECNAILRRRTAALDLRP